ncbi:MAG: alpha/beta hydrolase fold domain-containing protein, partial [Bacteroidaceae bacterium]|nr:alpha/beta hydrolase fold domain-containing protein [Bacteroidaceae bacterium]
MKKIFTIMALALVTSAYAQQEIRLYDGVAPGSEGVQDNERINRAPDGSIQSISGVVTPSITVYLPNADKATGTAVILCSGGGLMSHSWGSDVINMAKWLNERGIAAIGLKYRTRVMGGAAGPRMGGGGMALSATVTEFSKITKSNANPDTSESGIKNIDNAINDALRAMEIVREHASEWHIDPNKIGYLGFSAGGGV